MKILYVSRSNTGHPNPFVKEQAEALSKNFPVEIIHHLIKKGIFSGYIYSILTMPAMVRNKKIDIVHAHYGLSALAVILSKILFMRKLKVIITFHGSDINKGSERNLSLLASKFSCHNILVSKKMEKFFNGNYSIIPCGIDTDIKLNFRGITRMEKGWEHNDFIILFSSNFSRPVKDPEFAFKVVRDFSLKTDKKVKFIELKGYNREQLTQIMQAADVMLMCSKEEGSPQVIKESILNSLPIVSNDVGEVSQICEGIDNCFIVPKTVKDFESALQYISKNNIRVRQRDQIIEKFDNRIISNKLFRIYNKILK